MAMAGVSWVAVLVGMLLSGGPGPMRGMGPAVPLGITVLASAAPRARDKAQQTASLNNLKQIAFAVLMYAQDHYETLPPMGTSEELRAALRDYHFDAHIWVHPTTKEPYATNPALSGMSIGDPAFADSTRIVLAYERTPTDGRRAVAFIDGHAQRLTDDEWQKLKAENKLP